jgi:hypothetical protein
MNRDGQLKKLLTLYNPEQALKMKYAAHMDGLPLTATWIKAQIMGGEEK